VQGKQKTCTPKNKQTLGLRTVSSQHAHVGMRARSTEHPDKARMRNKQNNLDMQSKPSTCAQYTMENLSQTTRHHLALDEKNRQHLVPTTSYHSCPGLGLNV